MPHDNPQAFDAASWFVLWTQSHCERLVSDQLIAKGFHVFLPTIRTWSRQRGVRRMISLPMFPGYSFIRHAIDRHSYVEILKTRGVVRVLGDGWERLSPVADADVEAIQRIVQTDVPVFPHTYLREGQWVRIVDGPLKGVEGVLVHSKPNKGLLVISVELLRRSVAVEVDGTQVAPSVPAWQTSRHAGSREAHAVQYH
ncbi:MAG TPA: transcription termination/antitermination NusG family protein [Vicinamibacterales bacterium]